MIWPRRICFSAAFGGALLMLGMARARGATVTGSVEVGRADRSEVVVWLEPARPGSTTSPVSLNMAPKRVRMLQKDKRFQPHLLVVSTGTTVDFPNLDPIFHNAFSNFNGQIFDIGLYPPGRNRSVVFRNAGVVHVFCNIHPTMAAVIVVVASPYFAVTDAAGHYELDGVPPGDYELKFYNERSTPAVLARAMVPMTVREGPQTLPSVLLSEERYIPAPHFNKYGRPYPPGAGDISAYSLGR